MIGTEMQKSTSHHIAPVLAGRVKEKLIEAQQGKYDAGKERVPTPLCNIVGGAIVYIIQQEKMDLLLMRIVKALAQSDGFVDALT